MKKMLSAILALVMILSLTACGGKEEAPAPAPAPSAPSATAPAAPEAPADKEVELTIGTIYATTHPSHIATENFAKKVEELTNGSVKVTIYPNSQMGSESEIVQQVMAGDLDISCSGGGMWASYAPAAATFESLFMFRSVEEQKALMDSTDILDKFNEVMDGSGAHCVGWLSLGSRYVLSNKAVRAADDFNGLKIRVPDNPVYVNLMTALGANPTIVPWGDVYTALSSGMVEGCEADMANLSNSNLQETAKYLTFTGHITCTTFVCMNEDKWNSRSEAQQAAVIEAFEYANGIQVQATIDNEQTYIDAFADAGIELIDLPAEEMAALQAKATPVIANLASEYGLDAWVNETLG